MPVNLYWEDRGVYIEFKGIVKRREAYYVFRKELVDVEKSSVIKYELVDITLTDDFDLNEDDMKAFAANDAGRSHYIKNVKVAFVNQKEDIIRMLNIYIDTSKIINDNWQFSIFESLVAARKWVEEK